MRAKRTKYGATFFNKKENPQRGSYMYVSVLILDNL